MHTLSLSGTLMSVKRHAQRFSGKLFMLMSLIALLFGICAIAQEEPYKFGVLSIRERNAAIEQWTALSEYLSAQINAPVEFLPIKPAGMIAHADMFDLILTNPVSAVIIADQQRYDIIATLNDKAEGAQFGGVIIVHKNSPITDLTQLAGKRVGAVDLQSAAGGYLFQAYELVKAGLIPERDFTNFTVIPDQKGIALSVANKSIDAGFIRTGMLEALQKSGFDTSQVRILHEQTGIIAFPQEYRRVSELGLSCFKKSARRHQGGDSERAIGSKTG